MDCDTCKYYDSEAAECHRYPPRGDIWAVVRPQDWCGEYTPAASEDGPVERQVPDQVQQRAFRIYGSMPPQVADWCDQYPAEWVTQALARTAERGKRRPGYTAGILRSWWQNGGPDDGGQGVIPPSEKPDGEAYTEDEWNRLSANERAQATSEQNPYTGEF